jgi:nucleotide-binding universal stress UspA family protein
MIELMDIQQVPAGSIVVGIDGSPSSEGALSWAIEQAALEQRPLTIVHGVEPGCLPGAGGMYAATVDYNLLLKESHDAARALMTSAVTEATDQHPDLTVHRVLSYSDPRSTLLELGRTAAMIVLGSRGRGPIASLLLGSVSVSISKHAACPVVVHRPTPPDAPGHGILLGVDGTEASLPAIEFAYRMASWRAVPLTVLHCYWDPNPVAPLPDGAVLPGSAAEEVLVAESLAGMSEKFPEVDVQVRLTRGFADQHLVTASHDYDLVVIGHHPIPALNDLLYGSVAPAVVEHAHGAVAVVPSGADARTESPRKR